MRKMRSARYFLLRYIVVFVCALTLHVATPTHSYAQEYMLPYPSYMPGSTLYPISKIVDRIQWYWHFGSISRAKYHTHMSDTYLVEAKTLFEYGQLKLAVDALQRSDEHFVKALLYVRSIDQEQKDRGEQRAILVSQATVHSNVLNELLDNTPEEFTWVDEEKEPVELPIHFSIKTSSELRAFALEEEELEVPNYELRVTNYE